MQLNHVECGVATNHLPFLRQISLPRLLQRCADAAAFPQGRQLHALAFKLRLSADIYVQTSVVSMYASCGYPDDALKVFDKMPHRSVVTWTAAANAFLRSDRPYAAAALLQRMLESGISPDAFSLVTLLAACAKLGSLPLGSAAHGLACKNAESTPALFTAVIDMYCKCGDADTARQLFDSMPSRAKETVECWNAMLYGLAVNGRGAEVLKLFSHMEGVQPNEVTFLAVLSGCAHAGLVEAGRSCFGAMKTQKRRPNAKHYGAMVALLGRAGLLEEAAEMVCSMAGEPGRVVWGALLSACRVHQNLALAEQVVARVVREGTGQSDGDTSHLVILSSMYREAGQIHKALALRKAMGGKPRGKSWLEVGPLRHEFAVVSQREGQREKGGDVFEIGFGGDSPSELSGRGDPVRDRRFASCCTSKAVQISKRGI